MRSQTLTVKHTANALILDNQWLQELQSKYLNS